MVSRAKKTRKTIDMMGSMTVDALNLALPLAKAIPLLGPTIEGSIGAVLYILAVKDVSFSIFRLSLQFDVRGSGRQDEEREVSTLGRSRCDDYGRYYYRAHEG